MYFTVGTAGHIDHGKTALVGALTGMDTDRLKEEKKRGLSIELGFAHFDLPEEEGSDQVDHISIIDVPGHERFIRTMLAGTTGIDVVLFVVASDDGVMPQTLEHLDIVRLLGVESAVIVISKIDHVTPERVREVTGDMRALLKGTHLEGSPFIAASTVSGEGIEEVRRSLVQACRAVRRPLRGPFFRLPIDRSFVKKGFGTVVTGTVASGSVSTNDTVNTFLAGKESRRVRVRGIQSTLREVAHACVGARAALNLSSTAQSALSRGSVLAQSSMVEFVMENLRSSSKRALPLHMECSFDLLPSFNSAIRASRKGKAVKLFHLTGDSLASIRFSKDYAQGESRAYARVTLKRPLLCLRNDRFIIRDTATNRTIGGGTVLLPYYTPRICRRIDSVDFSALSGADISGILNALLPGTEIGFQLKGLDFMLNLDLADIIKGAEGFFKAGPFLLNIERFELLKEKLLALLTEFHSVSPSVAGLPEAGVPALLDMGAGFTGPGTSKVLIEALIADGNIQREASLIRLVSHAPSLAMVDQGIEKAILALFVPGFTAVKLVDLRALPFKSTEIDRVLSFLLKTGRLVKLKEGKFLLATVLDDARERLVHAFEDGTQGGDGEGRITVSAFRDSLGTGRKIAMEILEYFDSEHLTVRHGDYRVLREDAGKRGNKIG